MLEKGYSEEDCGKFLENMHVLVKGNLIETVSDEPLAVIQTDNVTMVDGGGRIADARDD